MKTKRNNRRNKNRNTMKGGAGNMFGNKIPPDYIDVNPIVSGTFWKKGHTMGSGWKQRKYKLFKKPTESQYVLIYFKGKTEKGNIKFNSSDVFSLTKTDLEEAMNAYRQELMDDPGIQEKTMEARRKKQTSPVANILGSDDLGLGLTIQDISGKLYPIFFPTNQYNTFMRKINNTPEHNSLPSPPLAQCLNNEEYFKEKILLRLSEATKNTGEYAYINFYGKYDEISIVNSGLTIIADSENATRTDWITFLSNYNEKVKQLLETPETPKTQIMIYHHNKMKKLLGKPIQRDFSAKWGLANGSICKLIHDDDSQTFTIECVFYGFPDKWDEYDYLDRGDSLTFQKTESNQDICNNAYMIRHLHAAHNKAKNRRRSLWNMTDSPLSSLGCMQAILVGKKLRQISETLGQLVFNISRLFRTFVSAQLINAGYYDYISINELSSSILGINFKMTNTQGKEQGREGQLPIAAPPRAGQGRAANTFIITKPTDLMNKYSLISEDDCVHLILKATICRIVNDTFASFSRKQTQVMELDDAYNDAIEIFKGNEAIIKAQRKPKLDAYTISDDLATQNIGGSQRYRKIRKHKRKTRRKKNKKRKSRRRSIKRQ